MCPNKLIPFYLMLVCTWPLLLNCGSNGISTPGKVAGFIYIEDNLETTCTIIEGDYDTAHLDGNPPMFTYRNDTIFEYESGLFSDSTRVLIGERHQVSGQSNGDLYGHLCITTLPMVYYPMPYAYKNKDSLYLLNASAAGVVDIKYCDSIYSLQKNEGLTIQDSLLDTIRYPSTNSIKAVIFMKTTWKCVNHGFIKQDHVVVGR